jgi:hypothetical protein
VVEDLSKIVAQIVDDVMNIAITVAGQVKNFVLQTVDQIGDLMEAIFVKIAETAEAIEDAIKAAIEWLKTVFNWSDILNTKEVVKYYINQCMSNMITSANQDAVNFVENNFNTLMTQVTNLFNNLETTVGSMFPGGITYEGYAEQTNGGGSNLLQYGQFQSAQGANAVQSNYIATRTQNNFGDGGSVLSVALGMGVGDSSPYDTLVNSITSNLGQDFTDAYQSFSNFLDSIAEQEGDILLQSIMVALEAGKTIVLFIINVIEDILVAFLNAVGAMIQSLQSSLNKTYDIPFISWLYKEVITNGSDLTFLDLVSLFIATPVTIIYKVMFGGSSAAPPFTSAQVQSILSTPIPWPHLSSESEHAFALEGVASLVEDSSTARTFALMAALGWAIFWIPDTTLAWLAWFTPAEQQTGWNTLMSWVGIAFEAFIQVTSFPVAATASSNAANNYAIILWCCYLVPLGLDIICTVGSDVKAVTRFDDHWGKPSRIMLGALLLALGISATAVQWSDDDYTGWNFAGNLIPPFPLLAAGLYFLKPNEVALLGLTAVHLVSDLGTAFVTYMGAPSSSGDAQTLELGDGNGGPTPALA